MIFTDVFLASIEVKLNKKIDICITNYNDVENGRTQQNFGRIYY